MGSSHRPQGSVDPRRVDFPQPDSGEELHQFVGGEPVGRKRGNRTAVFLQPLNVSSYQHHYERILIDGVRPGWWLTLQQGLDEYVFGQLSVLIVIVCWATSFDDPRDTICVAESAFCEPHAVTKVPAAYLAVLADSE